MAIFENFFLDGRKNLRERVGAHHDSIYIFPSALDSNGSIIENLTYRGSHFFSLHFEFVVDFGANIFKRCDAFMMYSDIS